jgi:hypothetical protein
LFNESRDYENKLEYIYRYSHLDSIKFKNQGSEPGVTEYFAFESSGVYILDLNNDNNLDLVYSGQNGWNGLSDTKYFIHNGDLLEYAGQLRGRTIGIIENQDSVRIITNWKPCCDSYTSTLNTYLFTGTSKMKMIEEVKFFGAQFLSGIPNFDAYKSKTLGNVAMYASLIDFHRTAPYFGKYNKSVRKTLFEDEAHVRILINAKSTKIRILNTKDDRGQIWDLVITEPIILDNENLFEWPANKPIRYVGWIKSD